MIVKLSKLPPSVNSMYANVYGKGRIKTRQYNDWLWTAGLELNQQHITPVAGEYGLVIKIKTRANADQTNYIKPLEDLLVAHGITPDDKFNIFTAVMATSDNSVKISILDHDKAVALKKLIENNCF